MTQWNGKEELSEKSKVFGTEWQMDIMTDVMTRFTFNLVRSSVYI